ncbi:MAG: tRNA lysidine(34) synthetase TilS, partial [Chloroflexales bacterium]|nr:tRNA lysidine(34) synthetase TilS [Chloroflexales bacterium]
MSDPLQSRVRAFLLDRGVLRPDALLLMAVSGGPDSLCLLHLLCGLRAEGGPALHVAHLDHGVRGEQARAEAEAVVATAAAWGVPATVIYRDVPPLARAAGEGLQAAARRARYAFLAATAQAVGAQGVAVAHQADDQAETVLLHALRGAGLAGLRGMREVVPWAEWGAPHGAVGGGCALIRPLLTTTRAEIGAYCARHELAPADDPSNSSPRYARARVRRLLPTLAAENPRVVAALGRTARVCADDYDFIQAQLNAAWPALAAEAPGAILLRREVWHALHPALQRYALRRAAARLGTAE